MNKTKRTLLVSSLIMTLALIVTVVSVSAAWFSNATNSKQDGLIIGSDTVQEFATLEIDSDIAPIGGDKLWPAIAETGWLLSHNTAPATGASLKSASTTGVATAAKCATVYFPIVFVGAPDSGKDDGLKSLQLTVSKATLAKYGDTINFLGDFNVEMSIVDVVKDGEETTITDNTTMACVQFTTDAGEPAIYILAEPNVKFYIKAVIYFNKIDEECNHELLLGIDAQKTITFKFDLSMLSSRPTELEVTP